MAHPTTTHDPELLSRELEELDRLLHRIKERIPSAKPHGIPSASYIALQKLRGLLRGKIVENPLAYQQRVRSESDARIARPVE